MNPADDPDPPKKGGGGLTSATATNHEATTPLRDSALPQDCLTAILNERQVEGWRDRIRELHHTAPDSPDSGAAPADPVPQLTPKAAAAALVLLCLENIRHDADRKSDVASLRNFVGEFLAYTFVIDVLPVAGMSQKEIGDWLGIKEAHMNTLIRRASDRLGVAVPNGRRNT